MPIPSPNQLQHKPDILLFRHRTFKPPPPATESSRLNNAPISKRLGENRSDNSSGQKKGAYLTQTSHRLLGISRELWESKKFFRKHRGNHEIAAFPPKA